MKKIVTLIMILVIFFTGINITIFGSTTQLSSSSLENSDNFFVDMNGWGVVTANSTGVICLTGNYIYNSNYQIKYTLRIIE